MARFDGKVVLVTGAGRGMGQRCALSFAEQGADLVLTDWSKDVPTLTYKLSTPRELEETVAAVERLGRRVVVATADVREQAGLDTLVVRALEEFGRIDVASINAGIAAHGLSWQLTDQQWNDTLTVNLTGAWHTAKAVIPSMIDNGGGNLVFMSSVSGLKGAPGLSAYVASKHGVNGLVKSLAIELASYWIRVNAVCPGAVNTPMTVNENTLKMFRPDLESPALEDAADLLSSINLLPVPLVEPEDVANAVLWLASEEARYVTGAALTVDAGSYTK